MLKKENYFPNLVLKMTGDARQVSESFLTSGLLTAAGGFFDTYTFLARGGVFANAQTGNIVLLGISLIKGPRMTCLRYLLPIAAFSAGVIISHAIRDLLKTSGKLHWRQGMILIEMLLLATVALIPNGNTADTAANILISFVCAIQFSTFRKSAGFASATTFCTGNLRSGSDALYRYWKSGNPDELKKIKNYFGLIAAFFAGILTGAVSALLFKSPGILLSLPFPAAAFVLMFVDKEKIQTE